jgi:hypothetical protein
MGTVEKVKVKRQKAKVRKAFEPSSLLPFHFYLLPFVDMR